MTFDELFAGRGLFLCQASAREDEGRRQGFWSSLMQGLLRCVGL